ncbi:multicopper oxidase family protein [Subtercola frigoramans]|uniref:Copper-containing nitrite reductase n=1 Tax=Subtercola frigoramans TaxID=120298 RepID=A0ABS2L102_9MICO|nr:multicopper oxidase family protein [Subtercola frigoramans]MBM7470753.1 FtsP/CotA-like multicopper oxidase with cupredoxin domain [Subtercola frigoramans]
MEPISRRSAITLGGIGAAFFIAGGVGLVWDGLSRTVPITGLASGEAFAEPEVRRSVGGVLDVRLSASPTPVVIGGTTVDALTYNGSLPGPTLVVRPGDVLKISVNNQIGAPTNLHTHGLHVSPEGSSDNVFRQVDSGSLADYQYEIPTDHPPGLFWYHPHHHGMTAEQVFAGMYGAIVVEDPDPIDATSGRVLVISDITFDSAGQILATSQMDRMSGREGEMLMLNGQIAPIISAHTGDREQWSIVNACTSRYLDLTLTGQSMQLLGNDSGRFASPRDVTELRLAPGNRADVLVTMKAGTSQLQALPVDRGSVGSMTVSAPRATSTATLATVVVAGASAGRTFASPPTTTPRDLRADKVDGSRTLTLAMGAAGMGMGGGGMMQFTIDGRTFDPNRVDQSVRAHTIEEWMIVNTSTMDHPFHLHVWPMQLVEVGGAPENDAVWRDVVNVPAKSHARVRIAFDDFTGKTVYHCHIFDHEDNGMMGVISVE